MKKSFAKINVLSIWIKMGLATIIYKLLRNRYAACGVPAIIINDKGEIMLGKRSQKAGFYSGYWGLPGGIVEYKEKMQDTIKREIKEELGVEVIEVKRGKNVYERLPSKECPVHGIDFPHYCKIRGRPKAKDETLEVRWFKPSEIINMDLAYIHKQILAGEKLI